MYLVWQLLDFVLSLQVLDGAEVRPDAAMQGQQLALDDGSQREAIMKGLEEKTVRLVS